MIGLQNHQHPARKEWAQHLVSGLPARWQKRLYNKWEQVRQGFDSSKLTAEGDATRKAAWWLQETMSQLKTTNIELDATDADICDRAVQLADQCNDLATVFHDQDSLRAAMSNMCEYHHVQAPAGRKMTDTGAIKRMVCPRWWRRQLRRAHGKAVEKAAISIGYVNKTRDIYVSNESLLRRRQQINRNQQALENTIATNENGETFTLAELAEKSTANKAIRRGELMTRIAGFERLAEEAGHVGLFFTMTCPSRMHKWRTVAGGKVVENKRYDGTTPREAQKYLSGVWSRIRAKLGREGFGWYGFRIAEPNHDGTPHWHLLVFFPKWWQQVEGVKALPRVSSIIRHYALADSPDEAGAKKHRVDFKPMQASKGTAAGYIAKYVSKNIDGYKVEKDLFGNDAITASMRVEAWAATWGIRQFQQIGGAPVTVWRELRRIKELPDDTPEHVKQAHEACNKSEDQNADWAAYTKAQGGVFCGREYRIKVAEEKNDSEGAYGDAETYKPFGILTLVETFYRDGIVTGTKLVEWVVNSDRHIWEIVRSGAGKGGAANYSHNDLGINR